MEMEAEKEKEMEKKYYVLHKKLDNLESQLTPIFSESVSTEITPTCNIISEKISQELHFLNNLLNAEMVSNPTPGSGRDEKLHLAQIARRVCTLQSVCRAWSKPGPTSSYVEMSDAPRCPKIDPYEDDHVDEDEDELGISYDDHEDYVDGERFNFYENPVFMSHGDDQDGLREFGEVGQEDNQDQDEEETVMDDSDTEERKKDAEEVVQDDDQNEVEECEESKITEDIIRVHYAQKEEMTKKEEEDDDADEVKTRYCYKVVFWVSLIGMGIISVMAGFSDYPEYYSSAMILTPT